MKYERIIAAVESAPWAITPEKARAIEGFLVRKANGEDIPEEEIRAAVESKRQGRGRTQPGGVALVPIYGVITQRADMFTEWSGGTSTDVVGRHLDQLAADPNIKAIVLDVDSPGGSVYGVPELADKINAIAKDKKVIAVANSLAASAAYWLAAQASEVVVSPGSEVGSIGVLWMHVDRSEAMAKAGYKVTMLTAGERKAAGHPYGPLDQVGREEHQQGVNDYYDKFVRAVARGRNATLTAVREGFGKGGMVRAEAAVSGGMADKIGTLDSVLDRYGVSIGDFVSAAAPDERPRSKVEVRKRRLKMG